MGGISAYVLIEAEVGKVKDVLKTISKAKEVKSVEAVTGPYDLIARIEATNIDALGKVVTDHIQSAKGVRRTVTCLTVEI
jgi:DNA-binding Lrp family transcriptional regulator